jgi:hypothetical protein
MNSDAIPTIVTMTIGSTTLLILAIIVILVRSRTPEMKLLLIGIFMAITAAMQANVSGVSVNAAQVALATGLGSATLMKISVILTLSGAGMLLMSRVTPPPPPPAIGTPKEHPHVD